MEPQQARDALVVAHESETASHRLRLPAWQPPVSGILIATGLCTLGLAPFTTAWRIGAVAIAAVCWVGAGVLLLVTRRRQGIRGLRGPARSEATTYLACGVAVFICGITPSADMRWIYVMAGVVGGALFWIVLARRGSVLR